MDERTMAKGQCRKLTSHRSRALPGAAKMRHHHVGLAGRARGLARDAAVHRSVQAATKPSAVATPAARPACGSRRPSARNYRQAARAVANSGARRLDDTGERQRHLPGEFLRQRHLYDGLGAVAQSHGGTTEVPAQPPVGELERARGGDAFLGRSMGRHQGLDRHRGGDDLLRTEPIERQPDGQPNHQRCRETRRHGRCIVPTLMRRSRGHGLPDQEDSLAGTNVSATRWWSAARRPATVWR